MPNESERIKANREADELQAAFQKSTPPLRRSIIRRM